ncbi:MAG TPA: serine/threonine-protein kinase, partial [Vicinamibacterales bacterium]|nr:serine/threonine-protein kinase [Vicinamibacterales bacterium]
MTPERWRQISAVFDGALALDVGARGRFLEDACADDCELRTEVEALLEAHDGAGRFGERPISVFPHADAHPIAAGTTLGPYRIEALVGAGGMGQVYKATDTRLGRTVAIKILPEHVAADEQTRQRFEREARTVAALSHPHICPLFDVGEHDGVGFLVMEYLEGRTLADRLRSGRLAQPEALRYAIQIADALDKA